MSLPDEACLPWIVNEAPANPNRTGTEYRTIRSPGANYSNIQTRSAAYYLWTQKLCLQRLGIHDYYGTSLWSLIALDRREQIIIKSAPVYMPNLPWFCSCTCQISELKYKNIPLLLLDSPSDGTTVSIHTVWRRRKKPTTPGNGYFYALAEKFDHGLSVTAEFPSKLKSELDIHCV